MEAQISAATWLLLLVPLLGVVLLSAVSAFRKVDSEEKTPNTSVEGAR